MKKFILLLFICLQLLFVGCSNRNFAQKKGEANPKNTKEQVVLDEKNKIEFEFYFIEGLKQKMIGNPDVAIQHFNKCLEINPQSAAVMYELAKIHVLKGDFSSAKPLLVNAIELNPENKWYNLLLAQLYQNNKQYAEASKIYSNLIESNSDNLDFYYLNAVNLASAEKFEEAIKAYQQLEEKFGFNEQIYIARQQLYRAAGKNKEAYQEIEKLIQSDPTVPEYYGIMADMYKLDGKPEKALEYYNKVLEIDPANGLVHFSLATFYFQNNNIEKAFEHAKLSFSNPDFELETKVHFYLMLVTSNDKKLTDSQIEELVKLINVAHPSDSRSYSIYADFYIQRGKFEEAREYLRKSVQIEPNSYSIWEQLVLIDNQIGDFQGMAAESEKAIELFPSQPLLYVLNSISLIQLKQYEKALKTLEEGQNYVVDNNKLKAQFELYKAEAYYNLNNKTEAFSAFEKVIEIEPDNFIAMNNYAYYLSVQGEQLDKAEAMSSRVVVANPDNPTYLDTHAWVLFKRKEYRLAKHYIETALANGGNLNDVIVEHYGDILFMLNDVEGAVANWKKAKELGNTSAVLQQKIDEKRFIEGNE